MASNVAGGQCTDILVINLDRSPERLHFQEEQFRRLGLTFVRIPGFDGALLADETYQRYAYKWERPIGRSEVGCLLSHHACWQHVITADRNTLILEDDVIIAKEIGAFLEKTEAIGGATAINLETRKKPRFLSLDPVRIESLEEWQLFELMSSTSGAGAYLLTPEGASQLTARIEKEAAPADAYLWSGSKIRRLQLDPGIAVGFDILKYRYGLSVRGPSQSSIARPTHSHFQSMVQLFRYPLFRARRIAGQISLAATKLDLRGTAVRREVALSPSILASYELNKDSRFG
jgi:glycosyl transferase, family 25